MTEIERRLSGADKVRRAVDLRLHGASWEDIARQVGYANPQNAHRAVRRHLKRHPVENADELRQQESMKLDLLEREAWKEWRTVRWATCSRGLVTDADDNPVPDNSHRERWAGVLLRIYQRRANLLGLDLRTVLTESDLALDADIEQLVAELNDNAISIPTGHPG